MPPWWLRAAVSLVVAAILLTFVPIGEVWAAIRQVDPRVWAAAVVVFTGGHALNSFKLRLLIGAGTSAAACLRAHFAGMAANLGLPGVAGGEVVRVAYLAPGSGTARVAMAAVADRIVDSLVLLILVAAAASVAGLPDVIDDPGPGGGRRLVIALIAIVIAAFVSRRLLRRTRAWPKIREAWLRILSRPGAVGLAMTISLGVQSAFVLTNVWLASEVGIDVSLAPWFLAWTGAKLSALLPISLGGLGVRDATLVSILAAYGAPADAALAVGILWEGAIVVGSLGGFLLTEIGRRRPAGELT